MRIERHNQVLGLVVAMAALLHFGGRAPQRLAEETPALFAGLAPDDVRRIEAERDGDDGIPRRLELQRSEHGWVLPQLHGAPAWSWSVDALLSAVASVRDADLVSERSETSALYGVDTAGTRVRLIGSGGVALATFVQGRSLADEGDAAAGGRGTFLSPRLEGTADDAVYRAATLAPVLADPGAWLDTRVLRAAQEGVLNMEVRAPSGELIELERRGKDWFVDAGGAEPLKIRSSGVAALLAELTALHFIEPLAPGAEPLAAVEAPVGERAWAITVDGDDPISAVLGRPNGTGRRELERTWPDGRRELVALNEASARALEQALERAQAAVARALGGQ